MAPAPTRSTSPTRYGARSVLVAIPSITGEQLRGFAAPLLDAGLQVLVLPPVAELLGQVRPSDIRPLTVADLLGRHPAEVDTAAIAGYITGRRVLVTGAGGSIGAELCRQLQSFEPSTLVMLDRDESGLHATQLELEGRALLDSPSLVLADIRDRERIFQAFQQHRPEVVFHAAALKHLPLLEFNPSEAWKTNVVGTHHVLEAAEAAGVARLVNVSSDKAADPASVLGFVKRICERLTAEVADRTGSAVRLGALRQRARLEGVDARRVRTADPRRRADHRHPSRREPLLHDAGGGRRADDPGRRHRPSRARCSCSTWASPCGSPRSPRAWPSRSSSTVSIVYTGLRPGEKLHEVLLGAGEVDVRPIHPLISQVPVPPLRFDDARAACSVDGRLVLSAVVAGDRRRVRVGRSGGSVVVHHDGGR